MRRLLLVLALAPFLMGAFGDVGSLLTANDKGSKSTWAPTTSAALESGNVGICILAVDNISTGGGNTSDHTTVTDAASNPWVKVYEASNAANAAAACTVSVWRTIATSTLSSGGAITFNIASNRTAWAATCHEFSIAASQVLSEDITPEIQENDNSEILTDASGTVASREHLFIRGVCGETNDATAWTADGNYSGFTMTSSTTSGGGSASNMGARGDYRILNATSDNNDPIWGDTMDHATIYAVINEDPAGTRRVMVVN
jgi:hypothetical protein